MSDEFGPEVVSLYERLNREAEAGGYHLNPDRELTLRLVAGLLTNQQRYGYMMCPCRLAFGEKAKDLDLICPCDYRDPDLDQYGACYCGLYLTRARIEGKTPAQVVPERRPVEYVLDGFPQDKSESAERGSARTSLPVWRCRVCGYLCARETPPETCPICKVKKDRFVRFEFA